MKTITYITHDISIILNPDGSYVDHRYYTVKEVAAHLRVAIKTVYALIKDGTLSAVSIRGCKRILGKDLNAYIANAEGCINEQGY